MIRLFKILGVPRMGQAITPIFYSTSLHKRIYVLSFTRAWLKVPGVSFMGK